MNKYSTVFLTLLLSLISVFSYAETSLKVACVGNSITAGSYPSFLQELLGNEKYDVRNYGLGGRTVMRRADVPYWNEPKYQEVLAWNPDMVIIKLGTNDAKYYNWVYKDDFETDYRDFVTSFENLPSNPVIYLCYPMYSVPGAGFVNNDDITDYQAPIINKIAAEKNLQVIDLNTPFKGRDYLIPDGIHPNAEGASIMAQIICKAICRECVVSEYPFIQVASQDRTDYCSNISAGFNISESELKQLIDNDPDTEFHATNFTPNNYIQFDFNASIRISGYSLTAMQSSSLKSWKVLASNGGDSWVELDKKENQVFIGDTKMKLFGEQQEYVYKSVRLVVTDNGGSSDLKLSEFQIFGSNRTFRPGVTNITGGKITASFPGTHGGEAPEKLIDQNVSSKYCAVDLNNNSICPLWIRYESPRSVRINKYALTSANDATERNPKSWILQGSNNGTVWDNLDTQKDQYFGGFFSTMEYVIPTTKDYKYFRLYVTEFFGNTSNFQLAEWQLFEPTKVACVGNSITEWSGYTDYLQSFLGADYTVRNFGVSGSTLLKHSNTPYWTTEKYAEALDWDPDLVIIKLGTNDAKIEYWPYLKNEYEGDYMDFVPTFQNLPGQPKIYLCYPVYNNILINGVIDNHVIRNEMMPMIDRVAAAKGCEVIDLNTPFLYRDYLIPDGVHPNSDGAKVMAQIICKAINSDFDLPANPFIQIASQDRSDYSSNISASFQASADELNKLFDNDSATSLDISGFAPDSYVQVDFDSPIRISAYSLTVAENSSLKSWKLLGSNGNDSWTELNKKENQNFVAGTRVQTLYNYDDPAWGNWSNLEYKSYRLLLVDNGGNSTLSLSEWQIFGHPKQFESSLLNNQGNLTASIPGIVESESVAKLIDLNAASKYCAVGSYAPLWIQYESPVKAAIGKYSLTSANDAVERSPKTWKLQGSDDGVAWEDIDSQQKQDFVAYFHTMEYTISPSKEYRFFRLYISEYQSNVNTFQLGEWQLFGAVNMGIHTTHDNSFKIYPTVLKQGEYLNVETVKNGVLNIYSLQGTLVSNYNIINGIANIHANLSQGVYIAQFAGETSKTSTKLIVK
ncbi:hypothetical protein FACS189413_05760 [Bacteroidia bacterium]|nr:hypothetical protein FACS189413_05760 [Bacteroidia bacterium]